MPGFPWGNTMIQRNVRRSSVHIHPPFLSLPAFFFLSLFTVIPTHHRENLNERGVKRASISNRKLSGSAWGLGLSHVCASVKDTVCGSVNWTCLSPPGTKWTATAGHRDQRAVGVSFHLLGISTPIGEKYTRVYVRCVTLRRSIYLLAKGCTLPLSATCWEIPKGDKFMSFLRQERDEGEDILLGQVYPK